VAAASFNVSAKTAAKCCPRSTSSPLLERVFALRRLRYNELRIAMALGLSRATVSRILRRAGMSRRNPL